MPHGQSADKLCRYTNSLLPSTPTLPSINLSFANLPNFKVEIAKPPQNRQHATVCDASHRSVAPSMVSPGCGFSSRQTSPSVAPTLLPMLWYVIPSVAVYNVQCYGMLPTVVY